MILDQIAWSDCVVFLIFLAPQLVLRVGFINTVACILKALPHLRRSKALETNLEMQALNCDSLRNAGTVTPGALLHVLYK